LEKNPFRSSALLSQIKQNIAKYLGKTHAMQAHLGNLPSFPYTAHYPKSFSNINNELLKTY
jgi:hypothetical protein